MRRWSRALLAPSSRPWELLRCACVQGSAVSVLNLATTGREAREAGREVPGLTPPSPSLRLPSALSGTRLYRNGRPPPPARPEPLAPVRSMKRRVLALPVLALLVLGEGADAARVRGGRTDPRLAHAPLRPHTGGLLPSLGGQARAGGGA